MNAEYPAHSHWSLEELEGSGGACLLHVNWGKHGSYVWKVQGAGDRAEIVHNPAGHVVFAGPGAPVGPSNWSKAERRRTLPLDEGGNAHCAH